MKCERGGEYNRNLTNLDLMGRGWEKLRRRLLHKWRGCMEWWMGSENRGENVYNLLMVWGGWRDIMEMMGKVAYGMSGWARR